MITGLTLPGMMLEPGCVSQLAETGDGSGAHEPDVGSDLPEARCDRAQGAVGGDHHIEGGLRVKVVLCLAHGNAGRLCQPRARDPCVLRV
jgi:hypothetical protein